MLDILKDENDENIPASTLIAQKYLCRPTAKQKLLTKSFYAPDTRYQPICQFLTLQECALERQRHEDGKQQENQVEKEIDVDKACDSVHFKPIYYPQTDASLGHCSYLNTCHRSARCKYLHFQPIRRPHAPKFVWNSIYPDNPMPIRKSPTSINNLSASLSAVKVHGNVYGNTNATLEEDEQRYVEGLIRHPARSLYANGLSDWCREVNEVNEGVQHSPELMPAQWIDADLKRFDYSTLGKFDVIVADPPWDIHMSLPYGTMSDDDMRAMPFPQLQDEGFLFLWVTGRAMELGRELLSVWGYTRLDEIVWIKVGQTQRLIRTGRTGHWLNHTKEHCLVGVKTKKPKTPIAQPLSNTATIYPASHAPGIPSRDLLPSWANVGLDTDVIVAEVRDTSRKPDELYTIIERICPKGRKIELFGRRHNARPGWITVGNQMKGDHIVDQKLKGRVEAWRSQQRFN